MTVHPPITAVQHTRCLLALTAITTFIDQLKPTTHTTSLDSHIHKITRWRDACKPSVKIKTLSAGARRDLDAAFTALAEQTLTTLAMALHKLEPTIAEQGTEMYKEVAL